jgi:hypothetical protein
MIFFLLKFLFGLIINEEFRVFFLNFQVLVQDRIMCSGVYGF